MSGAAPAGGAPRPVGRDLLVVCGFVLACSVPFLGMAWHVDDAHYLAVARRILEAPLDPLGFDYNWYGSARALRTFYPQTTFTPYVLAAALSLFGPAEWATRLALLPFDLLAAAGLYLLAAGALSRPLWPVLGVLASPFWVITMQHPGGEKLAMASGLWGLHLLLRGVEEDRRAFQWAAAGLVGLAALAKNSAVLWLGPFLWAAWKGGLPRGRGALLAGLAAAPLGLYMLWGWAQGGSLLGPAAAQAGYAAAEPWGALSHRLRALLAFTGGGAPAAAVWAAASLRRRDLLSRALPAVLAAGLLFSPLFDLAPVHPMDRALGVLLGAGGLLAVLALGAAGREAADGSLWLAWGASVALLQTFVYWSVVARFVLFLAPPLALAAWRAVEDRFEGPAAARLGAAAAAASLVLSLALASVNARHAEAHRTAARLASAEPRGAGRLWFTGHWGLQHYLEAAGARALDEARGGWEATAPGDLVVVPRYAANVLKPSKPFPARVKTVETRHAVPLRLLSMEGRQAGFYSSASGFNPFTLSAEPVEVVTFVRR